MKKSIFSLIAGIVALIIGLQVNAQDTTKRSGKWSYFIEPYLLAPKLNGRAGVGDYPNVKVKVPVREIFQNLKLGGMLVLEAHNSLWAINVDIIYASLEENVQIEPIINKGKFRSKLFAPEIAGLRRLNPWLEVGIGGLLVNLKSGFDIIYNDNTSGGTFPLARSLTKTWVEPMLLIRAKSDPDKKFVYMARGELGGFGIGSRIAFRGQVYAGYRFSKLIQLTGGFNILSLDYEKGRGANRFLFDVDMFGPDIRLGFNL